jgi:hypothetical protein
MSVTDIYGLAFYVGIHESFIPRPLSNSLKAEASANITRSTSTG